jgi:hypothetical protein
MHGRCPRGNMGGGVSPTDGGDGSPDNLREHLPTDAVMDLGTVGDQATRVTRARARCAATELLASEIGGWDARNDVPVTGRASSPHPACDLVPTCDAETKLDALYIRRDRGGRKRQPASDRDVLEPIRDQERDLPLTSSQ